MEGSKDINVLHGPCVETGEGWCVEAVWAGNFKKGDLDTTDLVFGSGIRSRDGKVIFVSPGTTLERLYYCKSCNSWYVSNTMPGLLACAKMSLDIEYLKYSDDIRSIERGLKECKKALPAVPEDINIISFHNLMYDGKGLKEISKPDTAPHFETFEDYHAFLIKSAIRLKENYNDPFRRHKIFPLTSISSGYDSPAVSVIARHAGCAKAVTIKQANSILRKPDSGFQIAKCLDMDCKIYDRIPREYTNEIALWAGEGVDWDLHLSIFNYPEPLCIFFTGFFGSIWDREPPDYTDQIERGATSGSGFSEFRIQKGVFQCAVPFWGARHVKEICKISRSNEMKQWTLMSDYDRPIPRRIVESANVPRGTFANSKKLTAGRGNGFYWPYSKREDQSYRSFLDGIHIDSIPPIIVWLNRGLALFGMKLKKIPGMSHFDPRSWLGSFRSSPNRLLFQWANTELKKLYDKGLHQVFATSDMIPVETSLIDASYNDHHAIVSPQDRVRFD